MKKRETQGKFNFSLFREMILQSAILNFLPLLSSAKRFFSLKLHLKIHKTFLNKLQLEIFNVSLLIGIELCLVGTVGFSSETEEHL